MESLCPQNIQNNLLKYIFDDSASEAKCLLSAIKYPDRIFIYRNAYSLRIFDSLKEVFNHTISLILELGLEDILKQYISTHKFSTFNINDVGADFSNFLRQKIDSHNLGWIADYAALEYQCSLSFHQLKKLSLTFLDIKEWLTNSSSGELWKLQPYVIFFSSRWPVFEIHKILTAKSGEDLQFFQSIQQSATENHLIIFRRNEQTQFELLSSAEHFFINSLLERNSLEKSCGMIEQLCTDGRFNLKDISIENWLLKWTHNQIFSANSNKPAKVEKIDD